MSSLMVMLVWVTKWAAAEAFGLGPGWGNVEKLALHPLDVMPAVDVALHIREHSPDTPFLPSPIPRGILLLLPYRLDESP